MQRIPAIDIGPDADSEKNTRAVEDACRDIGFMYVVNHGIDQAVIAGIRSAVVRYFGRPLGDKLRDRITRENYRGYIPVAFFSPNTGGTDSDNYEGYKLHFEVAADDPIRDECDLYGPNKWPEGSGGFRDAVLAYWQACDVVAEKLFRLLAMPLGEDPDRFVSWFDKPLTNMTLLHYPVQSNGTFGIHPHKDTDALTIIAGDEVEGLMVRRRDGDDWIAAKPPDDALVVNIGDMMELWSGGYFISTPHKVENTGSERYSFPYFAVPRHDVIVEPLRKPEQGFERSSVRVGDVSREVWRTNWPDAAPQATGYDLGTLED